MSGSDDVPACSGDLDLAYLTSALERAGASPTSGTVAREPLHGGRTGAAVERVRSGDRSFVVKLVPKANWRGEGMGCPEGGEPRLWLSGLTREMPDFVRWPVIDVALHADGTHYRMLMEDIGGGMRGRGEFTISDTGVLFRHLARMHARFYESDALAAAPLPSIGGATRVFADPLLHVSGKRPSEQGWVHAFLTDFKVMTAFVPVFLEVLGPDLADAYLELVADSAWERRLGELPATLLQGDLRRANIAFAEERVDLIDWEFAAAGPPGCDLQWHCLLHYWAYPPEGVAAGDDCDAMFDDYVGAFEDSLGRPCDRAELREGWELGWIKTMATLGYCLIDPLYPDGGTPEERERAKSVSARAVERALDIRARLGR